MSLEIYQQARSVSPRPVMYKLDCNKTLHVCWEGSY